MTYSIIILGKPFGKQRARTLKSGHSYTPKETISYENMLKFVFSETYPNHIPIQKGIEIDIVAFFEIPKSFTKKKRLDAIDGKLRPKCKPDFDNICKIVGDGLNKVAWHDDSQIVDGAVHKFYTDGQPQVKISFKEIDC